MLITWLQRAAALLFECLRLTHCAHAALTIEHDWPVIAHGTVPGSTMFASFVLIEAGRRLAELMGHALRKRREARALAAKEVADAAGGDVATESATPAEAAPVEV